MLKFRTLKNDHVGNKDNRSAEELAEETLYGKFLSCTSLNELPQLINILNGDMSFVGPRPRAPGNQGYEEIPKGYEDILSVRPGLTGPWQVAAIGKDRLPKQARLDLDLSYIRNTPGLRKDLSLMLKTIPAFLLGHDGESLLGKTEANTETDNSPATEPAQTPFTPA